MYPAIAVTLTAAAGVCLTVQPGRDIAARYARFTVAFFAAAPFPLWVIVAFIVTVGAIGTIPLAIVSSVLALGYRWTARPVVHNARLEARTAAERRKVRRAARRTPTAGTVLAAGSLEGALSHRPHAGQALDLPYSDTGSYVLVHRDGVPTLEPVKL